MNPPAKKTRRPVNLDRILSTGALGQLIANARAGLKLQERLKTFLGDTAADHFSLVRHSPRDLVLLADSPVWNSYLRFRVPMILDHLRSRHGMHGLENIHIKVALPAQSAAFPLHKPAKLSPDAARHLRQAAESTADPGLKSIYVRISNHTKE